MSPFKSSNSLQNSIYSWSFSKGGRFDGAYKKPTSDSMYSIPEGKSTRYATQGIGKRADLKNATGRCSPPPNTYNIRSCFEKSIEHKKGALFLEKFTPVVIFIQVFFIKLNFNQFIFHKWNKFFS